MKVTVESQGKDRDFPLKELELGEVGILTYSDGCARVGEPVVRGSGQVIFLRSVSWTGDGGCLNYRVRKLRPGERVILEGE